MNPENTIPTGKLLLFSLLVLLFALAVVYLFPSVFDVAELDTLDQRFAFRNAYAKNPVLSDLLYHVSLDDYSQAQSGDYDWGRDVIGDLILTLAEGGSDIVACDLLFSGHRDSTEDVLLADAVDEAANVVLAFQGNFSSEPPRLLADYPVPVVNYESYPPVNSSVIRKCSGFDAAPYPELLEMAYSSGYVNLLPDRDGVIRRYPLVANCNGKLVPSIAMASIAAYLDYDLANLEISSRELTLKNIELPDADDPVDISIPLDDEGCMLINWPGRFAQENWPLSYSAYDLVKVEDPRKLITMFRGKIGILGDISTAGKDYGKTPLETNFPFAFIYSALISSIFQGDFLRYSPLWLDIMVLLLCLVAVWWLAIKRNMVTLIVAAILMLAAYTALTLLVFIKMGWVLPVVPFVVPFVVMTGFATFYKFYYEQQHLLIIREGLRSYLSPPLLERMEKNPELLQPGGKRKYISVLFSDIANFTGFCDTNTPDEVQAVLDEYLQNMVGLVFEHNGIIDKYLGDGLLAFFENEEEGTIVSPANAVRTAIAMQEGAKRLREKWSAEGRLPIQIRVGIATGIVAVGNLGTKDKIDYTIIGSKVNLASRLQGKGDSGDIVVDEDTFNHIATEFTFDSMGGLDVKGFHDPVIAFKLSKNS